MEERPAMSRADFQARRDSSQGNWTSSSRVNCCHTVTVHTHSTRHSFSIILDSMPCPSMAQPSRKFWTLCSISIHKDKPVPRPFFQNCYIRVFNFQLIIVLCKKCVDFLCQEFLLSVSRTYQFAISFITILF